MMKCSLCGGSTAVYDSRPDVDCVNRKRRCLTCGYKFSTVEIEMDILKAIQKPVKTKVNVDEVEKALRLLTAFLEGVNHD